MNKNMNAFKSLYFLTFLFMSSVLAANLPKLTNICQIPDNVKKTSGFKGEIRRIGLFPPGGDYTYLLKFPSTGSTASDTISLTTKPQLSTSGWFPSLFGHTYFIKADLLVYMVAYFVPTETGEYTFKLVNSDDAAVMYVGNPSAFPCGSIDTWPEPRKEDINVCDKISASTKLYMEKGLAYPVRLVWYNGGGDGQFNAQFIDPSGTTHTDWNGYVWQYDACTDCDYKPIPDASTTTSAGYVLSTTTTRTSESSYTDVNGYATAEDFFWEEIPTSTESISIPDPTTSSFTNSKDYGEEIISFYSTTASNGKPITGTTTTTVIHTYDPLSIPDPITSSFTNSQDYGEEIISFYSTNEANGRPIVGSTTTTVIHTYDPLSIPDPITSSFTNSQDYGEEIISFYSTNEANGRPIVGSTTTTVIHTYDPLSIPSPTTSSFTHSDEYGEEIISFYKTNEKNGKPIIGSNTTTVVHPIVHSSSVSPLSSKNQAASSNRASMANSTITHASTTVMSDSIITSTSTTWYTSDDWRVEEIVSWYGTTDAYNHTVQGVGTAYFRDRVDALPVMVNSSETVSTSSQSSSTASETSSSSISSSNTLNMPTYRNVSDNNVPPLSPSQVYTTVTTKSTSYSRITITSCDDMACNVITTTTSDVVTLTTTYCPETAMNEMHASSPDSASASSGNNDLTKQVSQSAITTVINGMTVTTVTDCPESSSMSSSASAIQNANVNTGYDDKSPPKDFIKTVKTTVTIIETPDQPNTQNIPSNIDTTSTKTETVVVTEKDNGNVASTKIAGDHGSIVTRSTTKASGAQIHSDTTLSQVRAETTTDKTGFQYSAPSNHVVQQTVNGADMITAKSANFFTAVFISLLWYFI